MLVQLRPSSETFPIPYTPLKGVAEAALYCAHRASTLLLRALRARRAPGRSFPSLTKKRSGDYSQNSIEIAKFTRT